MLYADANSALAAPQPMAETSPGPETAPRIIGIDSSCSSYFPPCLVQNYLDQLCVKSGDNVLDLFNDTGTNLVE